MVNLAANIKQVAPLTTAQIAQFKRDGYLVLPAVLDPDYAARPEMKCGP